MEINNIDLISASIISEGKFKPQLYLIWVDMSTHKCYEMKLPVTSEFVQEITFVALDYANILIKDVICDNFKDSKEITLQEIINRFPNETEKFKPYTREENINKLIN